MTTNRIKWTLIIMPALVIGLFEMIRHTALLLSILPMDVGNWLTPLIDAIVIAIVSRTLLLRLIHVEQALSYERTSRAALEERERLARLLHDQIAQSIFYSGVQINAVKEIVQSQNDQVLLDKLNQVVMTLGEMDDNIRHSIFSLRTQITLDQDFESRIRSFLEKVLTANQIAWTLSYSHTRSDLDAKIQVQLFGILQEAVANIVKHSKATNVSVTFNWNKKGNYDWTFIIDDNGIGFDTTSISSHQYGIDIIKNRATEIGASVVFDSKGIGTRVIVDGHITKDATVPITYEMAY